MHCLKAVVKGKVQGVYFRDFTRTQAIRLGLYGYAQNLESGTDVEVIAEGDKDILLEFLKLLRSGPPHAEVQEVEVSWSSTNGNYGDFHIKY
ncbi:MULTISPECIES: acylphosphatase [Dehalococcoides]|uniref:acylphosphatase n=2 Tax=root TaxID=1 RepID=A0A0V8M0B9_9CHLR|nr:MULTISPECIES: acylphosphatase [Dehalococcoides]KSV17221.1 acylphosphatase [Dehalococcoides mccartyi]MEA4878886.1 acylphosphatase [Dehalococcoides mccartyi]POZ59498.1 Acylphosphate phosphohydrolase, putative [Dehalococcoides mccartyi]BAZ97485.1 acylphosphatase [Dehalococcoides mccartyi]